MNEKLNKQNEKRLNVFWHYYKEIVLGVVLAELSYVSFVSMLNIEQQKTICVFVHMQSYIFSNVTLSINTLLWFTHNWYNDLKCKKVEVI